MEVLKALNVTKSFPGVVALNNVSFTLYQAEVHALVGENGAGKSTLIKIFSGVHKPDAGEIFYLGRKEVFSSPSDAINKGIVTVHQEINLFENLTVAENIFVGNYQKSFFRTSVLVKQAQEKLDELDFPLQANKTVKELSASERQLVLIAKALIRKAKVLIMDEPTATITEHEARKLFEVINDVKKKGVSTIFISHRLDEIYEIADKVTILRDGNVIATGSVNDFSRDEIIRYMVGRKITEMYPKFNAPSTETILSIKNLEVPGIIKNVSFNVRKGEIFGITGLVGSGATIIPLALFGFLKSSWEEFKFLGRKVKRLKDSYHALSLGMNIVPEDRKRMGLFMNLDVRKNIIIQNLHKVSKFGMIRWKDVDEVVQHYIKKFSIKTPSGRQMVRNLSGGNQQKVVLAKVIMKEPKLIFFVEPTRGIDVGTKTEIYMLLSELANSGVGVVLVSSELPEVVKLCDRVLVMHRGFQVSILEDKQITQERIVTLATGG